MAEKIPHVELAVDSANVLKTLKQLVDTIRPHWDVAKARIIDKSENFQHMNLNYHIHMPDHDEEDFMIRVFSVKIEHLRKHTVSTMKFMLDHGLPGPALLCTFDNGVCMEFVRGSAVSWLNQNKIREEPQWSNIAREMALFHGLGTAAAARAAGIPDTDCGLRDDLLETIRKLLLTDTLPLEVKEQLPSVGELKSSRDQLLLRLKDVGAEYSFIHQDVNPSNILIQEDGSVTIVDYDCCSVGPSILDIAWFFSSAINLMMPSLNTYPSEALQTSFVRAYLEKRADLRGEANVQDSDVKFMLYLVRIARLLMHLRMIASTLAMVRPRKRPSMTGMEDPMESMQYKVKRRGSWIPFLMWDYFKDNFDTVIKEDFKA